MVGRILDVFAYDTTTWFGTLERTIRVEESPLATRLIEFMDFCIEWNTRSAANPEKPPDASDFDQFNDVIQSGLWFTETKQGEKQPIVQSPVFFPGGEVSWRTD